MKTETLAKYVEMQLIFCRQNHDKAYFNNAFGAVEYHLWMYHEDNKEIYDLWENKWKPEFEKLIWGFENENV